METRTHIKPGDYFYTSWGYDQTNIDYLVIESISATGKTARCRMASKLQIDDQLAYRGITPAEPYGEPFNMRITSQGNLRGSYPYISNWQGADRPMRLDTFLPVRFGDIAWETRPEFGH